MVIADIKNYIEVRPTLTKLEVTAEVDDTGCFSVSKTKETYSFEDELDANKMVDEIRRDPQFIGVEKKFKKGKVNKAGDVVKPDVWLVVAKLSH